MLTAEGCAARRERLWGVLPSPCDVLIVGDPWHLTYFAAYSPSPFVFRTVESGALLLLEPARVTLVADTMLAPFVDATFVDERVAPVWYDGQHSLVWIVVASPSLGSWPTREYAGGSDWMSSSRRCPRGSSPDFGRRGRSSRSSISDP